jgi:hypothetical protein
VNDSIYGWVDHSTGAAHNQLISKMLLSNGAFLRKKVNDVSIIFLSIYHVH